MEKLLRNERKMLKEILKGLYPLLYIKIKRNGTAVIKNSFFSFRRLIFSYEYIITDLIPRSLAASSTDPAKVFNHYLNSIDFSNNRGYGVVKYLYEEYFNYKKVEGISLPIQQKISTSTHRIPFFSMSIYLKPIKKQRNKALDMPSNHIVSFAELIDDKRVIQHEVIAKITSLDPEFSGKFKPITRTRIQFAS